MLYFYIVNKNVELIEIGHQMTQAGLSEEFVASAVQVAFEYEGVYDLMKMWSEETDKKERNEIVADIQDMIDECSRKEKVEGTYVRFDDLEKIAKHIHKAKGILYYYFKSKEELFNEVLKRELNNVKTELSKRNY